MIYFIFIQPKKQFKVQIICILEETTPFIGQICTFEKVPKNWTKSKRTAVSPQDTFPKYGKSAVKTIKIKRRVEN